MLSEISRAAWEAAAGVGLENLELHISTQAMSIVKRELTESFMYHTESNPTHTRNKDIATLYGMKVVYDEQIDDFKIIQANA